MLFRSNDTATTEIYTPRHTLSLHDALPIRIAARTPGFTGEVVQIRKAPLVVQNVVTYDVVVTAKNPDQRLLPGMTANVRIVIEQKESVLQVPNAALRFRPAGMEAPERERPARPGPSSGGRTGGAPGAIDANRCSAGSTKAAVLPVQIGRAHV